MGKILVVGRAERECEPDYCKVRIKIGVRGKTSSDVSKRSSELCEKILGEFETIDINPEDFMITNDEIDTCSRYDSNETMYRSEKTLVIEFEKNMVLVNTIRGIIEKGYDSITLDVSYGISDENKKYKELLKDAINDSRSKAELLAESMGVKIVGIDNANLSDDDDVFDLTLEDEEEETVHYMRSLPGSAYGLSDRLKSDTVSLKQEVRIVWLSE